ncbi:MAG: hypothetical protein ACOVQE_06445 [Chitinophagaceae bacterium]
MERVLNIIIGLILLNNFYYLSFFVGIDYGWVLIGTAVVSFLFFVKACVFAKQSFYFLFYNSALTLIVASIAILSIILLLVQPHDAEQRDFNDLIRMLIVYFYFGWTALKFGYTPTFKKHLLQIVFISLIITIPLAFFESYLPGIFGIMFKEGKQFDETTWWRRVGGTIRDPNAYACLMIIYAYFLYNYYLKFKRYCLLVVLLLVTLYLVNLSGSRQGFLLFFILIAFIFYDLKLSTPQQIKVIVVSCLMAVAFISYSFFSKSEVDSVVDRVLKENTNAENSSEDRVQSLINGVNFSISEYNGLYGPGAILFTGFWTQKFPDQYTDVAAHNAFIYHFSQFGIWCLFIYWGLWITFKKAYTYNKLEVALLFFIIIFFLSNILFYGVGLLFVWYLDVIGFQHILARKALSAQQYT